MGAGARLTGIRAAPHQTHDDIRHCTGCHEYPDGSTPVRPWQFVKLYHPAVIYLFSASEGAQAVLQIVHKATGMAATVTLGYAALEWLTSDAVPLYLKKVELMRCG